MHNARSTRMPSSTARRLRQASTPAALGTEWMHRFVHALARRRRSWLRGWKMARKRIVPRTAIASLPPVLPPSVRPSHRRLRSSAVCTLSARRAGRSTVAYVVCSHVVRCRAGSEWESGAPRLLFVSFAWIVGVGFAARLPRRAQHRHQRKAQQHGRADPEEDGCARAWRERSRPAANVRACDVNWERARAVSVLLCESG
jgi:hypothetical protein